MPELSIIFIGWFFSAISLVVLTVGGMMLMHLYKTGRLTGAYLQERGAQEIVLIAIWLVGLAAGAGVIYHHSWSQWLLEYFCWVLIVLVVLSGSTRMANLKKEVPDISRRAFFNSLLGVLMFVLPVVLFCAATIFTLRGDEAREHFNPNRSESRSNASSNPSSSAAPAQPEAASGTRPEAEK
jgi:heme/copper-type cytochrome/quinol oxidase subunit 2